MGLGKVVKIITTILMDEEAETVYQQNQVNLGYREHMTVSAHTGDSTYCIHATNLCNQACICQRTPLECDFFPFERCEPKHSISPKGKTSFPLVYAKKVFVNLMLFPKYLMTHHKLFS